MAFAIKQSLLLGLAVLLMFVPTILYSAGMLGRAPMFEGDVRKEMTCITCNGLGRTADEESCGTCHGRGVAEFIIPGKNRPLQLIGTIKDYEGKPVEGASISAREKGTDGPDVILETNGDGQFGLKLPPGTYDLKLHSEKAGSLTETLEVKPDPTPIPAVGYDTHHKFEKEFVLVP